MSLNSLSVKNKDLNHIYMNRWTELAELLSQLPVIDAVNATKKQLDDIRPLPQEVEGRVMQKLRLEWNYHSNAIEGNKLTRGETYTFLMQGLTAKAKPYKDHQDIKGHNKGIDFLFDLVKDQRDLTEGDIRDLHKTILVEPYKNPALTPDGQKVERLIQLGKYKTQPNFPKTATGEIHYYAMPEETPFMMGELVKWYNEARHNENIHPSVLAAFVHHRFVEIHPFDDGNGRLGRMLMYLILIKRGYPPVIIKQEKRDEYYAVLSQADNKEYKPLVEFIAESLLDSMNLYLKAARGESIEDDADLDKEIALFKRSFEKTYLRLNEEVAKNIVFDLFLKISFLLRTKLLQFDELFKYKEDELTYLSGNEDLTVQIGSVEELEKLILENGITALRFDYKWLSFNKTPVPFDFSVGFVIRFYKNDFELFSDVFDNNSIMKKFYDEGILISEKQKNDLANKIVKAVLDRLSKKAVKI